MSKPTTIAGDLAERPPPVALTIAGSDSSGGAGIQADLKTFTVHGVYGASVVTALTAQNTHGVQGVVATPASFVSLQIDAVLSDLDVRAAKTGMLANAEIIETVGGHRLLANVGALVVDPVMVATSGDRLIEPSAVALLIAKLLPLCQLVTPNLHEAALISGRDVAHDPAEMEEQGRRILGFGAGAVLVKGGHSDGDAIDLLVTPEGVRQFAGRRIATRNTHGSGCTLSAAITANLALGMGLVQAVSDAKAFVSGAIASADVRPVGSGNAPLDHLFAWRHRSGKSV